MFLKVRPAYIPRKSYHYHHYTGLFPYLLQVIGRDFREAKEYTLFPLSLYSRLENLR